MMIRVNSKDCECLARHIGIGNATCLNNRSNMFTLILELALQGACGTMLGHLSQSLAGHFSVLPEAIVDRV